MLFRSITQKLDNARNALPAEERINKHTTRLEQAIAQDFNAAMREIQGILELYQDIVQLYEKATSRATYGQAWTVNAGEAYQTNQQIAALSDEFVQKLGQLRSKVDHLLNHELQQLIKDEWEQYKLNDQEEQWVKDQLHSRTQAIRNTENIEEFKHIDEVQTLIKALYNEIQNVEKMESDIRAIKGLDQNVVHDLEQVQSHLKNLLDYLRDNPNMSLKNLLGKQKADLLQKLQISVQETVDTVNKIRTIINKQGQIIDDKNTFFRKVENLEEMERELQETIRRYV